MKKIGTTALLALLVIGLTIAAIPVTKLALASDGWTQVSQRGLKAYPDLVETVWQKNASAPPNGQYDKIGLHRVVSARALTGIGPIGVLFICPGTWGSGEQLISNPPADPWTFTENDTEALYWANRGFDVYSVDYRTHFVPTSLSSDQLSFMANWGWDQWISDIKEAVDKAKEVSGAEKIFMAGQSFGGIAAMNYATLYWQQDLKGLIMLDAAADGLTDGLGIKNPNPTNSYNLTDAIAQMNAAGTWGIPVDSGALSEYQYADLNPGAPAPYPYNYSFANITAYLAFLTYNAWGAGGVSNLYGGYGNVTVVIHICATFDPYWPTRLSNETTAYIDWTNCPYVTHDFDDNYSDIDVPLLAFQSQYFGNSVWGPFQDGIANPDFTTTVLLGYGHLDVFSGVYSARDVSTPTYDWMISHTSPVHDVAVTNLTSAKTVICQGYGGNLTVTAPDQGTFAESFNVTVYANATTTNTLNFSFASWGAATQEFVWNTTGFAYGNYTLEAAADVVSGETNTTNNNLTGRWVIVSGVGDITGGSGGWPDGITDMMDISYMAMRFMCTAGTSGWKPNADINNDGIIDMMDISTAARHFMQTWPYP